MAAKIDEEVVAVAEDEDDDGDEATAPQLDSFRQGDPDDEAESMASLIRPGEAPTVG